METGRERNHSIKSKTGRWVSKNKKKVILHIDNLPLHTAVSTWAADKVLGRGRIVVQANKQIGHS